MELRTELIDLEWGDEGVVPPVIHPDTTFIFTKMGEIIIGMLEPADGEWVVDVGCGRAVDVLKMAEHGMKAIGIEPSARMIDGAREHIDNNAGSLSSNSHSGVALVRAIGEALPFRRGSLDKLICKGSLDHFVDMQRTMADMAGSLKPDGVAVIAVANFDSLSCRLGRAWHPVSERIYRIKTDRHPWQPPDDHNYKFDCKVLKETVKDDFEIKKIRGMSLLWTAPYWGKTLSLMPGWASSAILKVLDWTACVFPSLSDIIIVKLTPKAG